MAFAPRVRHRHPIGRHVAAFAVPSRKLVIEIDGRPHAPATARDDARSRLLEARGWRAIRFPHDDVMNDLSGVLVTVAAEIDRAPYLSPTLAFPAGAEGE